MKKIIASKIYNTETATLIAHNSNYLDVIDANYFDERLYKTKDSDFLLEGEGSGISRWSDDEGKWGEGIELLTPKEALEWCKQSKMSEDIIKQNFTVVED